MVISFHSFPPFETRISLIFVYQGGRRPVPYGPLSKKVQGNSTVSPQYIPGHNNKIRNRKQKKIKEFLQDLT